MSDAAGAGHGLAPFAALPAGRRQVHLLGFMGSGKSTVARLLARRLVWSYLDLDALVARHSGRAVADIFATDGEPEFRRLESRVLRQAVQKPRTVLALGGGTTVDPENRRLCERVAVTIWLRCPLAVIRARLGADDDRPLWRDAVDNEALFAAREGVYAEARHVVDASVPAAAVAAAIVDLLRALE